jgi:hypothetical protein
MVRDGDRNIHCIKNHSPKISFVIRPPQRGTVLEISFKEIK